MSLSVFQRLYYAALFCCPISLIRTEADTAWLRETFDDIPGAVKALFCYHVVESYHVQLRPRCWNFLVLGRFVYDCYIILLFLVFNLLFLPGWSAVLLLYLLCFPCCLCYLTWWRIGNKEAIIIMGTEKEDDPYLNQAIENLIGEQEVDLEQMVTSFRLTPNEDLVNSMDTIRENRNLAATIYGAHLSACVVAQILVCSLFLATVEV